MALDKMRKQLRVPPGTSVQCIMLQGDPATELLAFASTVGANVIATGSHGHGFIARMVVGSVTTRILRCATCSVLCVPYAAAMTHVPMEASPRRWGTRIGGSGRIGSEARSTLSETPLRVCQ